MYRAIILICVLAAAYGKLCGQINHSVGFHNGMVANPTIDQYNGALEYHPNYSTGERRVEIGGIAALRYHAKSFSGLFGPTIALKVYSLTTLNGNFDVGSIYLEPGHLWDTKGDKIAVFTTRLELSQLGIGLRYGRDYVNDANWWSLGLAYTFVKKVVDDDE